jgi:alpha-L-rhamnosidase
MRKSIFFLGLMMFPFFWACENDNQPALCDLTCENLRDPLGIDTFTPRFSWKISSQKNGTEQKAFQILVASDPSLLQEGKADFWDSGKIESSESVLVPYQGKPVQSGLAACWKVRIWDEEGNASDWSPAAFFSIGLLENSGWKAEYIGCRSDSGYRACPQLMKTVDIENTGGKLFLHVNSLGYHEVYLNGNKVGDGVLAPAVSQFDKRSWALTYDVSSIVKKGPNELLLWLGSGWYTEGLPGVNHNGPLVKAQLEQIKENRREIIVATDGTWLGRESSYLRHGDWRPHRFGGETVNGTLAKRDLETQAEWTGVEPGFGG